MGIKIKGLKSLLTKLDALPQDIDKSIEIILQDNARQLEFNAKRFAPVRFGDLRRSIQAAKNGELSWRVYVSASYGPYMEFGTGGLVQVPPELAEIAIQFKGKGIKKIDLRPQPYLYPAFEIQRDLYVRDMRDLLERETKRI